MLMVLIISSPTKQYPKLRKEREHTDMYVTQKKKLLL